MRFSIPLFVETRSDAPGTPLRHHVRPLFFRGPSRADEDLSRAQQRLVGDLQQTLLQVGRAPRHDWLAAWNFCPQIEQHRIDVMVDLRRRTARGRFFFAVFRSLDRRLAFCPSLPTLWFEIGRNQSLEYRAAQSLSHFFRKLEQEADDESDVCPEDFALQGTAWVTTVDLELEITQSLPDPARQLMALLGSADVVSGAQELRNCGRCLNWLYPGNLDRAHRRDHEVAELERRLLSPDRRPVLLLGRRLSGKTAIVHEYVSRTTALRQTPYSSKRNVWLLSPQRLVSGMSYVGQWESRLLAILKEARKRNHVLYFDDLPGLLQAGKSRDSSLSMSHVIRPYLERREIRLLAEITPEAWRILRERDRALADLFDVLPVVETDSETTARIVLATRRTLEQDFRCRFALDSLPTVLEIERRYSPDAGFPGKAVRFLKDLALIHRGNEVTRDHVLNEFHRRSGLASRFLDPRQRLLRSEIVDALTHEVVGQPEPVAAVADVLSIAKARLNDTGRPMGSLLFVGPTGVGKTQLARAAARFLFEDPNRILRFDLNEYITRGSAARLVGTFDEPDGLLTGSVRRQPFAVVLLDEIEKAHPEVFDVLLQVLGEGRLSDGIGRTVSFSNTLIIMTSNLGVRENSQQLGFGGDAPVGDHVWQKAAERFFRPEFFNRIDRIVPFQRLSREVVHQVAEVLLKEMLLRDGLVRRRCVLTIEPQALQAAVDAGYSPTLGARALKRSLDQMLIQPAGRRLAAMQPRALTQLHLHPAPEGIAVHVQELQDAMPAIDSTASIAPDSSEQMRVAIDQFVSRVEAEIAEYRPTGPISASQLSERHQAYYLLQERCRKLREMAALLTEAAQAANQAGAQSELPGNVFRHARKSKSHRVDSPQSFFANLAREEADMATFHLSLRELFDQADLLGGKDAALQAVLHETALTEAELRTLRDGSPSRVVLCFRRLGGSGTLWASHLATSLQAAMTANPKSAVDFGIGCELFEPQEGGLALLTISGLAAAAVAQLEEGVHLYTTDANFVAIQVLNVPVTDDESAVQAWQRLEARRADWLNRLATGTARIEEDPWSPGPVVRLYERPGLTLDLRTGDMTDGTPDNAAWQRFLLGALPLPVEFRDASQPGTTEHIS